MIEDTCVPILNFVCILFQLMSLVEDLMREMQQLKDFNESLKNQLEKVSIPFINFFKGKFCYTFLC